MVADDLIDFVFSHEKEIKNAIFEKRLDPGGIGKPAGSASNHSQISDPTANKGIKHAVPIPLVLVEYGAKINGVRESRAIKQPETWLQVVEEVKGYYQGTPTGEFLRRRYEQKELWNETCKHMVLRNKSYYYTMKQNVIHCAELAAVERGLLSPFNKGKKERNTK